MNDSTRATRSELDVRLMSPQGTALRDAYLTRLSLLEAHIRTQLSAGVNPSNYATGRALAKAVNAAATILEQYPSVEAPAESVLTSAPIPPSSSRTTR